MTDDWWRLGLVSAAVGALVGVSVAHGVPAEMPAASLGWPLLLHVERAVALLGLAAAATLVGVRATRGRFPVRFGQIEYPADDIDGRALAVRGTQEERIRFIEGVLRIAPPVKANDGRGKQI
jgi:hypothetical protein